MKICTFTVNPFQQNSYLVFYKQKAFLIDAGFATDQEWDEVRKALQQEGVKLTAVLLTHAHLDHIFGLNRIVREYDVPIFLHPNEQFFITHAVEQAAMFGVRMEPIQVKKFESFTESTTDFTELGLSYLFTPGHSPGHISIHFYEEQVLFAGDTLFEGSIGRTDLYKGDFKTLEKSIQTKLYTLPAETQVFSGHGNPTSIERERRSNPFVRPLNP